VRISDVAPDGQVTQVTGAALNGTHRNSARQPEDIVPGETFPLEINLHFTSWVFSEGHRIRVPISNSQWPMLWPTPMPLTTTMTIGGDNGSREELPVIPQGAESAPDFKQPDFKQPRTDPTLPGYETMDSGNFSGYAVITSIQHDTDSGEAFGFARNTGAERYPWGVELFDEEIEHRTSDTNPARTSVVGRYKLTEQLKDRTLDFEQTETFTCDAENFHLKFHRWVLVNGEMFREKTWEEVIPRDYQ
jgi:hypothetical protein